MGIIGLCNTARTALTSSQIVADPASVVKELVDNAIDAHATAIVVEISPNTLDIIRIRDNGHGIAATDRNALGRRHWTSKIKDLQDLQNPSFSFLGFRGEALASITELSKVLTVSTRVQSESTGIELVINKDGTTKENTIISHAIGTTVCVQSFLEHFPVRRNILLQTINTQIRRIISILRAYAFARLDTRFSFQVPASSRPGERWLYAPSANVCWEEAALKIVGRTCFLSCKAVSHQAGSFRLFSLLPRVSADTSDFNGFGSFFSINSRPVDVSRGFSKHIASIFKARLRKSIASKQSITEPFLLVSITCSPDNYDVDVEAAKDNVIFADEQFVLNAAEALLKKAYPLTIQDMSFEFLDASTGPHVCNNGRKSSNTVEHDDRDSALHSWLSEVPSPTRSNRIEHVIGNEQYTPITRNGNSRYLARPSSKAYGLSESIPASFPDNETLVLLSASKTPTPLPYPRNLACAEQRRLPGGNNQQQNLVQGMQQQLTKKHTPVVIRPITRQIGKTPGQLTRRSAPTQNLEDLATATSMQFACSATEHSLRPRILARATSSHQTVQPGKHMSTASSSSKKASGPAQNHSIAKTAIPYLSYRGDSSAAYEDNGNACPSTWSCTADKVKSWLRGDSLDSLKFCLQDLHVEQPL